MNERSVRFDYKGIVTILSTVFLTAFIHLGQMIYPSAILDSTGATVVEK